MTEKRKQSFWRRDIIPVKSCLVLPFRRMQNATEAFIQIATCLTAGIPLHEAVEAVIHQKRVASWMRRKLSLFIEPLMNGVPLSELVAQHGFIFPWPSSQIIHQGEISGNLPDGLLRAADRIHAKFMSRRRFREYFKTPVMTLLVFVSVSTFLNELVMETFLKIADSISMPHDSLFLRVFNLLIPVRQFIEMYWASATALIALALILKMFSFPFYRFRLFRWIMDLLRFLILPGSASRRLKAQGETFLILGDLLETGMPLSDALKWSGASSGSAWLEKSFTVLAASIEGGQNPSAAIRSVGLPPLDIASLIVSHQFSPDTCRDVGDMMIERGERKLEIVHHTVGVALILLIGILVFLQVALIHFFNISLNGSML